MTTQETKLVSLIGKREKSLSDMDFINTTFYTQYNKKKNQLKRVAKQASAHVYGWAE